jgi:hypothetical protein
VIHLAMVVTEVLDKMRQRAHRKRKRGRTGMTFVHSLKKILKKKIYFFLFSLGHELCLGNHWLLSVWLFGKWGKEKEKNKWWILVF